MKELIESKKLAASALGYEIGATYLDTDFQIEFVVEDAWFDALDDAVVFIRYADDVVDELCDRRTEEYKLVKPCYVVSD